MNIKSLLERYNVDIANERSNDYDCLCPLHKDSSPSFSIRKDDGVWICRAGCGSGNATMLVARIEKCSYDEAKAKVREYFSVTAQISDKIESLRKKMNGTSTVARIKQPIEYPYSYTLFGDSSFILGHRKYYQYITNRIPLNVAKYFRLGFCTDGLYANRIILPVHIDGELYGYTARSIEKDAMKRYLIPTGVTLSKTIWGYDQPISADGHAWLCESIFDALTLFTWGYRPVFATFGANISNDQIGMLIRRGVSKLTLCYHNDAAGIKAIESKARYLNSIFSTSYVRLPEDADVNEMNCDVFSKLPIIKMQDESQRVSLIQKKIRSKRK